MPTIQMNTRIDERVKSSGDSVFERVGYTPTRVVRAIWGYASRHEAAPEDVAKMLRMAEGTDENAEERRLRKMALAEQGPQIFESFLSEMGIDEAPIVDDEGLSPAEERERAAVERAREKGWFDD